MATSRSRVMYHAPVGRLRRRVLAAVGGLLVSWTGIPGARAEVDVVIVVGAGGADEYASQFAEWAERWRATAEEAGARVARLGPRPGSAVTRGQAETLAEPAAPDDAGGAEDVEAPEHPAEPGEGETRRAKAVNDGEAKADPEPSVGFEAEEVEQPETEDRKQLVELLGRLKEEDRSAPLWVVMIGHGTFQQGRANFNLRGPDISSEDLAAALADAQRPLVVVNCASASGPFIAALSGENRVVVTATRGGDEQNFARFGDYLSQAIGDLSADLDHDQRVSILEAFLSASGQLRQYYERRGQLATEHSLIDDNGDQRGTPPEFFRGIRVVSRAQDDLTPDGELAARMVLREASDLPPLSRERQQRVEEIEVAVNALRERKSELDPDAYYAELEKLMVEMAKLLVD